MPNPPAVFAIEAIPGRYFHGVDSGQNWNGWACPLFALDEAIRLAASINESEFCGHMHYDATKDAFLSSPDEQDENGSTETFAATVADGKTYYAIGGHSWCWENVSDDPSARFSASVFKELQEMKRIGMDVPDRAFTLATDAQEVGEYLNMRVSDAADLLIQLSNLS